MSQIAAVLAPTVLPTVAGALAHADAAATQGTNFADVLAQFQSTLLTQFIGSETAPTPDAAAAAQVVALPGQPALPSDIIQATPPAKPLSPLDILALPPSKPRTEPDALGEGGAAVVPPDLALLNLVFPAAQAQPLPNSNAVAAPKVVDVAAVGLRGTLLPDQTAAAVETQAAQPVAPETQANQAPSQATQPASPAAPVVVPQLAQAIAATVRAKQTATSSNAKPAEVPVENAAAAVDQPSTLAQSKPADAPQGLSVPKPNPAKKSLSAPTGAASQVQTQPADATKTANHTPEPTRADNAPTPGLGTHAPTQPMPTAQKDATATPPQAQPSAVAQTAPLPTLIDAQTINTAVVAAPQAGVPLDALGVHIARKFQEGSSQFELRLHPLELGRLDISLTVAEDGRVQAVLRAERPETLDMLQRDARLLEQQLRQAGLEVGSNALSFSLSNGNGQRQTPFTGWPAFADAHNAAGAAKEEAVSAYIAVRTRDGLDIRV